MKKEEIQKGKKFNRWTTTGDIIKKRSASGKSIRYLKCLCSCGVIRGVLLYDLKKEKSKSCGCLATDLLIKRNKDKNFWTKEIRQKLSEAHKGKVVSSKSIEKTRLKNIGKKRTLKQRKRISKSLKGSVSSFWRGGVSTKHQKIRSSAKYRDWRNSVFKRDNWTCIKCKKRGGYLEAHHIKSFAQYPKLRFLLLNGATLCKQCHKKTDNYGYNNAKERTTISK